MAQVTGQAGTTNSPTVTPMIANLGSDSTTKRKYDPAFEQFMAGIFGRMNNGQAQNFNVQDYTMDALRNLTTNPGGVGDVAGQQFGQIAAPLLQQQQNAFKTQQGNLSDMFRKAGMGTQQSGAFAQAARQLVNDQGQQQQQIIASNYMPLLQNATNTQMGAINAGLNVPGAQAAGQNSLNQILGIGMGQPRQTDTSATQQQLVQGSIGLAR